MSDDLILADAIYAAGQALHVDACTEGDPHDGCDCGDWDREAEIAVRAALPSIEHQLRELIAQAIEALPNLSVRHFGTRPLPDLIRKDTAARIARGDASNDLLGNFRHPPTFRASLLRAAAETSRKDQPHD